MPAISKEEFITFQIIVQLFLQLDTSHHRLEVACQRLALPTGGWEDGLAVETAKAQQSEEWLKNAVHTHRKLDAVLGDFYELITT